MGGGNFVNFEIRKNLVSGEQILSCWGGWLAEITLLVKISEQGTAARNYYVSSLMKSLCELAGINVLARRMYAAEIPI